MPDASQQSNPEDAEDARPHFLLSDLLLFKRLRSPSVRAPTRLLLLACASAAMFTIRIIN